MKRCKQLLITLCILAMLLPQMLVTGIFQAEAATLSTAIAKIGETPYDSLEQALSAAVDNDTVTLTANATATDVSLRKSKLTLDLNGYTLTADHVWAMRGANIVDTSPAKTGMLTVPQDAITLDPANTQLPVWNGTGYIFSAVNYTTNGIARGSQTANSFTYWMAPQLDTNVLSLLTDNGAADNELTYIVRLSWSSSGLPVHQEFTFTDSVIKKVYTQISNGSNYGFYLSVSGVSAIDCQVNGILQSSTGVIIASNTVYETPPSTPDTTDHTALSTDSYYQYSNMGTAEKAAYTRLRTAVESMNRTVDIQDLSLDISTAQNTFQRFMADHPQYFWLSRRALYAYNQNNEVTRLLLAYTDGTTQDTYNQTGTLIAQVDAGVIASQKAAFSAKIEDILATIPVEDSDLQKELAIHDYILNHVTYDDEAAATTAETLPRAYDSYGAACDGSAVCEGYSKLFQYLCYRVGINATQVIGQSKGSNHMWNAVCINGQWYHMDTTWDDGLSTSGGEPLPYYAYFNITTSEITAADHTIDSTVLAVPSCTATAAAYYDHFAIKIPAGSAVPTNLEAVADRLATSNEGYLLIYMVENQIPDNTYFDTYLLGSNSTLGRYLTQQGYAYSLQNTYFHVGNYLYFPLSRTLSSALAA